MKLRTILLAAVLAVLLPLGAGAAVSQGGAGLKVISDAARQGDAEAQLELGILYEFGYGMANNQIVALAWYTLAAQQGNQKAVARRDILRKRLSQAEVDKAETLSAKLLGKKSMAATKVKDTPATTAAPPVPGDHAPPLPLPQE